MMKYRILGGVVTLALCPVAISASDRPTVRADHVPFRLEEVSGNRPIIDVKLGDIPYRMMVHANADFYMQMNHATARKADARLKAHAGAYGIEHSGKVSALGRDEGDLPMLTIGRNVWRNAPASVFETPADGTGMLGLRWITQNRIVVDFPARSIDVMPDAEAETRRDRRLRRAGYTALPMAHDARTGKYTVAVPIGTVTRRMVVSMVAGLIVDRAFAQAADLPVGAVSGDAGGPSGAIENNYSFGKAVSLSIGPWRSKPSADGTIQDVYGYDKAKRPADPAAAEGGALGADFLIAHRAVVDFGKSTLYLR